jgi:hypothetical protein
MPVDFPNLVHLPCQDVFGEEILVNPTYSRPGHAPYKARGIFRSLSLDVALLDGTILDEQRTTIDIRIADFKGQPTPFPRDIVTVRGIRYTLTEVDDDGQGGQIIRMIVLEPDYPT